MEKKIPNVVGSGTFPNVVEFPSLQAVPRINKAALQGPFGTGSKAIQVDCRWFAWFSSSAA